MVTQLRRFFSPEYMITPALKRGETPSFRTAYSNAFSTAWAAIVETFLLSLTGIIDTGMVSTIGDGAIAAVGLVSQPIYLVQNPILALNIAVTSICARRKGQGDRKGAINCLKLGILLSAGISVLMMLVFLPFSKGLLGFMGANVDTLNFSNDYFRIILVGVILSNVSRTISAAQRGIGETRSSMIISMTVNLVDVIFNYLLINGIGVFPKLGVRGAAIATVMGWGFGLIIAIYIILNENNYLCVKSSGSWRPERETIKSILKVGNGSFAEMSVLRMGFILTARLIASLGTTMLAAHNILMNLMSLSFSIGDGFSISAASLVGQNLGAKRPDLAIIYGKICQRMTLFTSSIIALFFVLFCVPLVSLFTDTPEILAITRTLLPLMCVIFYGQATQIVFLGALRGAGDTKFTAIISLFCILIIRPLLTYLFAFVLGFGLLGAWIALTLDQYLRAILTTWRFSSGRWIDIKL